ncbi:MAG TPA: ABC transporter permease [Thermoanaerobaculia bacterium]|jgi:putative ABC transport system permease protein|nr:ABC transporter permease [Thermoanaerobaculia bacterium]
MLAYHLRIAVKSLRRTPVLSALLVAGIALGIAVSTAFVAAYHTVSRDPIPAKSRHLFYVSLDSWDKERPFDDDQPKEPPDQNTYRDAVALLGSKLPTRQTAMYKAELTVFPEKREERPFRARTRVTFGDFFPLFDAPFQYGGGWGKEADQRPQAVVVLDRDTNDKLFGGVNSIGRRVRIEDREFTVSGVLAPWYPKPKFYDPHNGAFEQAEQIYIPFRFTEPMRLLRARTGNLSNWKSFNWDVDAEFFASEAVWIQYWVQLDTPKQKEAYTSWLAGYAGEQKKLGRFERPINNKLRDVREWLRYKEVVPRSSRTMLLISLLFLVVSSVNLIGILLGKFLARSPEVGMRRALGASRRHVFLQHLIECELVGVLGGIVGVGLSLIVLRGIDNLRRLGEQGPPLYQAELPMLAIGILLALAAGLVAGLYPAWRICRIPPAAHLKAQ